MTSIVCSFAFFVVLLGTVPQISSAKPVPRNAAPRSRDGFAVPGRRPVDDIDDEPEDTELTLEDDDSVSSPKKQEEGAAAEAAAEARRRAHHVAAYVEEEADDAFEDDEAEHTNYIPQEFGMLVSFCIGYGVTHMVRRLATRGSLRILSSAS